MSWFKILARAEKPEKPEKKAAKPRKKPKPLPLSQEDRALWAEVAHSATPLAGRVRLDALPLPTPKPIAPASSPRPHEITPEIAAKPPTLPPLARLEKRTLRALSRGSLEIDARIDLHGMRQSEAHGALLGFLHRAHHGGAKLVLVITGKGGGVDSNGEERGVLRRMVPHWLADPVMRRIVMGFESAQRGHGGEGALYVRLRRKREGV